MLLAVAVLISLTLSLIIWTNPSSSYRNRQNPTNSGPQNEVIYRPKQYIYSPIQAVYNDRNGNQEILANKRVNMISEIKKAMVGYDNPSISLQKQRSKKEYLKTLKMPNSILLDYGSPVSLKMVSAFAGGSLDKLPNYPISRIILPIKDNRNIYLLNDYNFKIYRVKLKKHSLKKLNAVLKMNYRHIKADTELLNNKPMIFINQEISLKPYRYLIDKQSMDYYVSRLLSSENSQNVSIKKRKNITIYNDQSSRQLTFNGKTQIGYFADYGVDNKNRDLDAILAQSYNSLINLGISLSNVHFYNYDSIKKTVMFRTFVDGFPVYRKNGFGAVSIKEINDSANKMTFALSNPEVPLPTEDSVITLPSTKKVMNLLLKNGYDRTQIFYVGIGYQWQKDEASKMIIKLVPNYYIYYRNKWYTLNEMVNYY